MSALEQLQQQHISSSDSSTGMEATQNKKLGGWKAIPYILANETFERLAVSGFVANFMVYLLRVLHLDQVSASNINNLWNGLTNLATLVGAFISDAYVGRFWTIAFSSFASLMGMMVLTLTACLPELHPPPCTPQEKILGQCVRPSKSQIGVLVMGLGFLTIGAAGVRPCSIPFGVDQFDPTTDEGKKGINSFINWYYATFSVVLSITLTVVIYIQESVSWKLGFGIPTVCMFCSITMFFIGSRLYVRVKAEGSIFSGITQVLVAAYRKRHVKIPSEEKLDESFYDPPLKGTTVLSKLPLTKQFKFLNKAAVIMAGEINSDGTRVNQWRIVSIQQVEEVKCLARIFPIWTANILSLTSMAQQWTFTISQALQMDRHLGPKFQIPPGSLSVISFVTVCMFVPFYGRALIPALRKITKHERGITVLQRMGIGMVFSILSMVVAGLVEKTRRDLANSKPSSMEIAPMSVMWLAPQITLMGLCEAFNLIGQIEFFNRQFPEHMRSIANALLSCSFGLANYVSSFLVTTVHHATRRHGHSGWLTNDLNAGRLDYFYYLIAGMGVLNLVYYLYIASKYRYKGSVEL